MSISFPVVDDDENVGDKKTGKHATTTRREQDGKKIHFGSNLLKCPLAPPRCKERCKYMYCIYEYMHVEKAIERVLKGVKWIGFRSIQ